MKAIENLMTKRGKFDYILLETTGLADPGKKNVHIIGLDKQFFERKIVNIFLPISFNICFGCSEEPSH